MMTGRHGPPLFSLNYNVALEAVNLMRRREADPHHGQGRDRPSNRPDRLLHPQPTSPTSHPPDHPHAAGGVQRWLESASQDGSWRRTVSASGTGETRT